MKNLTIINKAILEEIKEDYPNWKLYAPKEKVVTILRPIKAGEKLSSVQEAFIAFKFKNSFVGAKLKGERR
jgi:hypothetical protein